MQERFNKYFWDGGADCCSGPYRLRRIIEYASFPDLIMYPFEEVKRYLPQIELKQLRTSQNRIEFMQLVKEKEGLADSWDEVFYFGNGVLNAYATASSACELNTQ